MSERRHATSAPLPGVGHLSLRAYVSGFVASLVLTIGAYLLVVERAVSAGTLIALILVIAVSQFAVQLVFFLHLGAEARPRWRLAMFLTMVTIVLILVVGSLWIMGNLNSRMSMPEQEQYMSSQGGL